MQIKGNNIQQARLTIRVSRNTLSFSVVDREAEHQLIYEPYTVKSGVSMAANLRQAFKESALLQRGYQKVRVYLDSPILLVPIEEFHEEDIDVLYQHAFNSHNSDAILYRVQPELNAGSGIPYQQGFENGGRRQLQGCPLHTYHATDVALSASSQFHRHSPQALCLFPRQEAGRFRFREEPFQILQLV